MAEKRGWCSKHYQRWKAHGDPLATARTPSGEARRFYDEVVKNWESDECLPWPYGVGEGYGVLNGDRVYRILCKEIHGPRPTPKHEVAHNCGIRLCVNKRHLRWATRRENIQDAIEHDGWIRGMKCGHAKLNHDQVREIRAATGTHQTIAARFGISGATVSVIKSRKRWAHVPDH